MALPIVAGWLTDYRTARLLFDSKNNLQITHFADLCSQSRLAICHTEESLFRGDAELKSHFVDGHSCICEPDEAIMKRCIALRGNPQCRKLLRGSAETAIILTAIALERNYGVISNSRNLVFTTIYDLCGAYGVPIYSHAEYFAELP